MNAPSLSEFTSPFERSASIAVGEDAVRAECAISDLQRDSLASVALGKSKQDALENLYTILSEACQPGWDGYDSSPASYESYLRAQQLIEMLPATFPSPEAAVDPDGEVSLEWYRSKGRVFSVSIGANDILIYAGTFSPTVKTHGTEPFTGRIPKLIIDNIRRLLA